MRGFRVSIAIFILSMAACADVGEEPIDGPDDSFLSLGKADAFGVVEGSPEACAVLRLVNEASYGELYTINKTAAHRIYLYRDGSDGSGTGPKTIDTLAELDAIPYVGPATFDKLLTYALVHYQCGGQPDPIANPAECMILRAANESSLDQLDVDAGLDHRAADAIVGAQPIASLAALDALPYVGPVAIEMLGEYALAEGLTCEAACTGTGGTFDGISFTGDEECRAVDFMNRARLSQMVSLGTTLRHFVYDCFPIPGGVVDCRWGRNRTWTQLAQLEPQVGTTSMVQLKDASAAWTDDGAISDTIAHTWQNRDAMINGPVGFDKVFVVLRTNPSSTTKFCYELRDTPTAPNYLSACVDQAYSDSSPPCSNAGCLDNWVGKYVALRGVLKTDTFGYVVKVAGTVMPHAPRD